MLARQAILESTIIRNLSGRDYLRVVVPDYTKTFCIGDRGMDDEDDDPVLEVKFIPQTDNQATLEVMEAALREDLRS